VTNHRHTSAVVLAAGLSTRMGATKPLLQLGGVSVLQRIAEMFRAAGVEDVTVVTGHDRERVAAEISRLDLREAHNSAYEQGMFTSVQAGARSVPSTAAAFFILPVDCPLVTPETITELRSAPQADGEVVYPTCLGRRGHPPLISGTLRAPLVAAPSGGNLRDFLLEHASGERELEMEELSILLDMDTMEDYRMLDRLAAARDELRQGTGAEEPRLGPVDADHLLLALDTEDRVIRHCRAVAAVATTLAQVLNNNGSALDIDLVRTGGLLHDMAKGSRRHAVVGQRLLTRLGLPQLADIVGSHMVLPEDDRPERELRERDIVYLADKMVVEDVVGSLETRTRRALETHGHDDLSVAAIERRMGAAHAISLLIERQSGQALRDVLAEAGILVEP
jgi:molybdenum cofactor cytidylyltransferase